MLQPLTVRLVVAATLAFAVGWVDVLGIVWLGGMFFAFITGNVILFGVSLSPGIVREEAGIVKKNPAMIYLCVIGCNLAGVFIYHWYIQPRPHQRPQTQRPGIVLYLGPGTCVALMTFLPPLIVIPIYASNLTRSPWLSLLFAPCFGAINALAQDPPLQCGVIAMTNNLQKLSRYAVEYLRTRTIQDQDHYKLSALMPLFSMLGATSCGGMLWISADAGSFNAVTASLPFVVLVGTLIVYDYIAPCMVLPITENATNDEIGSQQHQQQQQQQQIVPQPQDVGDKDDKR